jgi:hypothetical protein
VGYRLEVANDVINHRWDCPVPSSRAVRHHVVGHPGTIAVPGEWPTARRCTVAALQSPVSTSCLYLMRHPQHAPRAITTPPARTSGRYLGNTQCTSVTCEPFFIYCSWPTEAHDTQDSSEPRGSERRATWWLPSSFVGLGVVGHAVAPEPPGAERRGSRAAGRVVVPKPSHLGSRDPELQDS